MLACSASELKGKTGGGPYTDFILDLDDTVGRLMEAVKKKGAEKRTLFLFTSDNGGVTHKSGGGKKAPVWEAQQKGLKINGDLRGRKHGIHEGGFRVPFVVRWPQVVKAGSTCEQMVNLVDTYATLSELLGVPMPDRTQGAEDSVSFLPQLKDPLSAGSRKSMVLHSAKGRFAIRQDPWKLIEGKELYDLGKDPAEENNLLKTEPEVAGRLQAELDSIRTQVTD